MKKKLVVLFTICFALYMINSIADLHVPKAIQKDDFEFEEHKSFTEPNPYNAIGNNVVPTDNVIKVLEISKSTCKPAIAPEDIDITNEKHLVGDITTTGIISQNPSVMNVTGKITIPKDGLFKLDTPATGSGMIVALYIKCSNSDDIYAIVPYTDNLVRASNVITDTSSGMVLADHLNIPIGIVAQDKSGNIFSSSNNDAELVFKIIENEDSFTKDMKTHLYYPVTKGSYVLLMANKWYKEQISKNMFKATLFPFE